MARKHNCWPTPRISLILALTLVVGPMLLPSHAAWAARGHDDAQNNEHCEKSLNKQGDEFTRNLVQLELNLLRITLEDLTQGQSNPFESAGDDPNKMGEVVQSLALKMPLYADLLRHTTEKRMNVEQFQELYTRQSNEIKRVIQNDGATQEELNACAEMIRLLNALSWATDFPVAEINNNPDDEQAFRNAPEPNDSDDDEEELPDFSDAYRPFNKEVNFSSSAQKKKVILKTTADIQSKLVPMVIYDVVDATGIYSDPSLRGRAEHTVLRTSVTPKKKLELSFLRSTTARIPKLYGYSTLGHAHFDRLTRQTSAQSTQLDVVEDSRLEVNAVEEKNYLIPSGANPNDWPVDLITQVKAIAKSSGDRTARVNKLRALIMRFSYFSKGTSNGKVITEEILAEWRAREAELERRYSKPVAMAHLRAVNCDGAAHIGAILLKDILKIPARVATGYTFSATREDNGERWSAVRTGSPLHAWVEVAIDGRWVPFDFTPQFTPATEEQDKEEEKPEDDWNALSDEDGAGEEKDAKEGKPTNSSTENGAENAPQNGAEDDGEYGEIEGLGEGFLDQIKSTEKSPLLRFLMEALEVALIEESFVSKDGLNSLIRRSGPLSRVAISDKTIHTKLSSTVQSFVSHLRSKAMPYSAESSVPFSDRVSKIREYFNSGKFREGWKLLCDLESQIYLIEKSRLLTSHETTVLSILRRAREGLNAIRHDDSESYDLVERLVNSLPGPVSREWIEENYGNPLALGSPALHRLATNIRGHDRSIQNLQRIAWLAPFVNWLVRGVLVPAYEEVTTYDRSPIPIDRDDDYVIARSVREFPRMILSPRPGEHIFSRLFRREQVALGSLDRERIPSAIKGNERKKTILLVDLSGSMVADLGGLTRIKMAELVVLSIIDKVMAEVDPDTGEPMHEVVIIPYSDNTEPPVPINTREDAKRYFSEFLTRTRSLISGTKLSSALIKALEEIALANERYKDTPNPLKSAGIVNITDCGDNEGIDEAAIQKAKNLIPEGIPVIISLIGLEEKSSDLVLKLSALAKKSSEGALEPHIFDAQEVSAMERAVRNPAPRADAFATNHTGGVPFETLKALSELSTISQSRFVSDRRQSDLDTEFFRLALNDEFPALDDDELILHGVVKLVRVLDLSIPARRRLAYEIIKNYARIVGRGANQLTKVEHHALRRLKEWTEP